MSVSPDALHWEAGGTSRIPFAVYTDEQRHQRELARYDQTLDYLNTRDYRQAVLDTVEREKRLLQRMNLLARTHGA